MPKIQTETKEGKTVIFGFDQALGFFFDLYDGTLLEPSASYSTIQDGLMPDELLERISECLSPDKKAQLDEQIESIIDDGLNTMFRESEIVSSRTNFFIVALLNIT